MMVDQENQRQSDDDDLRSLRPSSSSGATVVFGGCVVALIFVGLGVWAATAPLAQAVAAYGTFSVKGERKQIQHFEGGIVRALNVEEGQRVKKGDLLIALDPLKASASVARHDVQLDQALALESRLNSELQGASTILMSGRLLDRLSENNDTFNVIEAEQKHLTARLATKNGTLAILTQRIEQLGSEIKGLKIQQFSRVEQLNLFEGELVGLRGLHAKGYYPKTKILSVERAIAQLRGAAGNDLAQISRAESARGEARNQIVNVEQRFREDGIKQLRDVQMEISDLNERLLVAKDILKRINIKAPRSGVVQGVRFHTVGGVVKPGDVIMEIAPQNDDLVVNAQVSPTDIDSVEIGQRAEVRLTALNARTTPAIYGYVISISGDSLVDARSNAPYFLTRIEIPMDEREKLGDVKLTAGMPADALIQTGERTALNYILKPVLDAFARGLNEE